jgi:hypothetical protein
MAKILFDGIEYNECYIDDTRIGKINFTDAEGDVSSPFVMEYDIVVSSQDSNIRTVYIYDDGDFVKGSSSISKYYSHGDCYWIMAELRSADSSNYFPVIYTIDETGATDKVWHNNDYYIGNTSSPWVETSYITALEDETYYCTALPRIKAPRLSAYAEPDDRGNIETSIHIYNDNDFDVVIIYGTVDFYEDSEIVKTTNLHNKTVLAGSYLSGGWDSSLCYIGTSSNSGVDIRGVKFCHIDTNTIVSIHSAAIDLTWGSAGESETETTTTEE